MFSLPPGSYLTNLEFDFCMESLKKASLTQIYGRFSNPSGVAGVEARRRAGGGRAARKLRASGQQVALLLHMQRCWPWQHPPPPGILQITLLEQPFLW